MKKNEHQVVIAKALIFTLLLGAFYFPGNQSFAETSYLPYAQALNKLGVLEGTDKGYELDRPPTRLEGLILFIKLLGEQDELTSIQTFTTAFDDVPGWGSAYAEYAHAMGYTSGIAKRTFGSSLEIQANSYMTYLLRALGYETEIGDFHWSTALEDAVRLKVITEEDKNMLMDTTFTRGHVAYLSYEALKAQTKNGGQSLYETLKDKGQFTAPLPEVEVEASQSQTPNSGSENTGENLSDLYNETTSLLKESEIIAAYDAIIPVSSASYYSDRPIFDAPYKAGTLSTDLVQSALDMLNLVRLAVGLSSNIEDDATWNELAQHASLVNFLNKQMAHYPDKPTGMSDEMYDMGALGARTSNLYYGFNRAGASELKNTILGYMDDSDDFNVKLLGHRRWFLHPDLAKVGVGYVTDGQTTHSAIKVFDENGRSDKSDINPEYVAWPSPHAFPTMFFDSHVAWSVSPNPDVYDNTKVDEIEVRLENITSGQTTTFKQDELMLMTEGTSKYFNIDTKGYGIPFVIIFRPDKAKIVDNHIYTVKITGLYKKSGEKAEITYATRFFDM